MIVKPPDVAGDAPMALDRQVLWFGLLAVGLTRSAWLPLATTSKEWADLHASQYLHFVGGLGPALLGVLLTAAHDGRHGLRVLWRRVTVGPGRWLTFAILAPATAYVVAIGVASAFGVHTSTSASPARARSSRRSPLRCTGSQTWCSTATARRSRRLGRESLSRSPKVTSTVSESAR